ncbi:magnesium/cobalt transporter CorA [Acaryochloris sp. 'Moss Beach']|uniref:magnesium/cobalt transporter CorA n=1 Tax=Acaryochloris sp. 'Moss Beach' TaxID=2740837 RepID=UPI001F21FCD8|nr:magnesium/cobalt transporter CorA [Acaryochloris sp. 'Moss Beach']UJB69715.1 magnesium/cobalt transporter CorA [Acaryochloris sp. 'Moss Beach']
MTNPLSDPLQQGYVDYFYDQAGSSPGTLTIDEDASPTRIVVIDYNPNQARRIIVDQPEESADYLTTETVSWIDVQGLGDEDILRRLGQTFNLHPLVLEDVVNVPQRQKVEDFDDQLLIIARMVLPHPDGVGFVSEQVSFILHQQALLTIQEEPYHDSFGPVRKRIRLQKGLMRKMGADFLTYALLDAIIDGFFPVLELYGERLETLEDEILENPTREILNQVHSLKRELMTLRRLSWSQRDALSALLREDSPLISQEVKVYLRDCYDHSIQILDMVETYRDFAASLMDVYLSSVSNKMNEVMKVLTVISTIFIPLTFISGLYGMNFNPQVSPFNMPELSWYWGYPAVIATMLLISGSLSYLFWRRGWFSKVSP